MSADESRPPPGGGPRRPEKADGYSEAFQEGIAEANFFVQQGLFAEAVAALEELQRVHGADPRILGRLHVARTKMKQAQGDSEPQTAPAPPGLTPPPASKKPSPELTPPPAGQEPRPRSQPEPMPRARPKPPPKPMPRAPAVAAGPPPTLSVPQGPVLSELEPAPLPPVPEFASRASDAVTNPIAILPSQTPITPLGRRENLEVDLELEEEVTPPPVVPPSSPQAVEPVQAWVDASVGVALPAAMPAVPPAAPPAPAPAAMPISSAAADSSPSSPFERKRAVVVPETASVGSSRKKLLVLLAGVLVLIVALVLVLVIVLKRRGDGKPAPASKTPGVASAGDSMRRSEPPRRPPVRRAVTMEPEGAMVTMAPDMAAGGDNNPGMTARDNEPSMASGGDDATMGSGGDDADMARRSGEGAKPRVQLRLTVDPKGARATIYFRGGKYLTNRFVSRKVRSRSTSEVVTIRARGYVKQELKLTLDQDLERTVKLRRKAHRMKLFDLGSKR